MQGSKDGDLREEELDACQPMHSCRVTRSMYALYRSTREDTQLNSLLSALHHQRWPRRDPTHAAYTVSPGLLLSPTHRTDPSPLSSAVSNIP